MSNDDLEQAFSLIDTHEGDFHGPKSEELIAQAEKALELRFPPSYRRFLERYGCGDIEGFEVYGLINDDFVNSAVPDAIWLTIKYRAVAGMPLSLFIIGDTGDGGYNALDLSHKGEDGESPVVEWWPGAPADAIGNRKIIAKNFGSFLLEQVQQAIDDC